MIICWHGTKDARTAAKIEAEGFQPGTYFARHLEDALAFGCNYVFAVRFEDDEALAHLPWQFHIQNRIPPARIWTLKCYAVQTLIDNPKVVEDAHDQTI